MHYGERKLAVGSIGTEERRSIGTEERRRRGLHVELPAAAAMAGDGRRSWEKGKPGLALGCVEWRVEARGFAGKQMGEGERLGRGLG